MDVKKFIINKYKLKIGLSLVSTLVVDYLMIFLTREKLPCLLIYRSNEAIPDYVSLFSAGSCSLIGVSLPVYILQMLSLTVFPFVVSYGLLSWLFWKKR